MTRSRSRRRAACNAVRNATWSATLHRTCLRHIPISHRSRVTRHLPADIGHGNGWILLSDSTNQRRAMAGYCYQILTNQSFPPMRGTDCIKGTAPSFLLISFCDTYPTPRRLVREHSEELSKNASIASRGRD